MNNDIKVIKRNPYSLSEGLINKLDELFPDRLPNNTSCTLEDLRFLQGQRSVIDKLTELMTDEHNEEHY
jgi:hypothetical protein